MRKRCSTLSPRLIVAAGAGLAAIVGGCGSVPPTVSLKLPGGAAMVEPFTSAYTRGQAGGDDRVILVRDGLADTPAASPGAALSPVTVPLRQVLTVRLLYRPMPGARGDSPAASNAALHWYVLGNPDAGVTGLLQYEGTGFASITPGRREDSVVIQNATLTLVQRQGELVDPLHTFTINGRFVAKRDDGAADAVLAEIDAAEHPVAPSAPPIAPSTTDLPTTFPATLPTTIPTPEPSGSAAGSSPSAK